jgi:hypothetical protein
MQVVPGTGIEPVRPLFRKAADFKSAVSTNFTTRAGAKNDYERCAWVFRIGRKVFLVRWHKQVPFW